MAPIVVAEIAAATSASNSSGTLESTVKTLNACPPLVSRAICMPAIQIFLEMNTAPKPYYFSSRLAPNAQLTTAALVGEIANNG